MSIIRLLGVALLVVGVIFLGFGLNSSQAITEQVVEGVSGRFTDNTMFLIAGGIGMIIGGIALSCGKCCNKD